MAVRRLISHQPDRHANTFQTHTRTHTHTQQAATSYQLYTEAYHRGRSRKMGELRKKGSEASEKKVGGINKGNGKSDVEGSEVTQERVKEQVP